MGKAIDVLSSLVVRRAVGLGLASLIALVAAGFILGGYLDASGATEIPGMSELQHLPKLLRILIELVIGVPIVFGIALYGTLETVDLVWFLSSPIRKLSSASRRR